jgi:hypothetical protein
MALPGRSEEGVAFGSAELGEVFNLQEEAAVVE